MDITQLSVNSQRLWDDFEALCRIGATLEGGVSRPALSLEDLEARAWFANCIEEAGLFVSDDDAGNLSGVLASSNPNAKTLMLGSHLDTVPNGGFYDGAIGVLAALECARVVQQAKLDLPVHLEVMNFTDEEGTWFSLLGSRGLTGQLPSQRLYDVRGENGAFRAALARAGINIERIQRANRKSESMAGFLELHIEQSGILDQSGVQVGVVEDIVGRMTTLLTFRGEAGHSGTTSMYRRRDALQGAALFVTQAHMLVQDRFDGGVVNCGSLEVFPGTFNIIPERVQLLVECRHRDSETLVEIQKELVDMAQICAETYDLTIETERRAHIDAAKMDSRIVEMIRSVCERFNVSHAPAISYAGHDAQAMSSFTPTGMIFIPSVGGISHTPAEFTHWDNVVIGANVLLQTALCLAYQS